MAKFNVDDDSIKLSHSGILVLGRSRQPSLSILILQTDLDMLLIL
jgi:hypothetical protein